MYTHLYFCLYASEHICLQMYQVHVCSNVNISIGSHSVVTIMSKGRWRKEIIRSSLDLITDDSNL